MRLRYQIWNVNDEQGGELVHTDDVESANINQIIFRAGMYAGKFLPDVKIFRVVIFSYVKGLKPHQRIADFEWTRPQPKIKRREFK